MTLKILLMLLFSNADALAVNCGHHPIYCRIKELNPKVDSQYAMKLSNHIHKYSRMYNMDPMISVAIAMQESAFRNVNRKGTIKLKNGTTVSGVTDVGVFQINIANIDHYKIDYFRLQHDLKYQTYWHYQILREMIRICKAHKLAKGREFSCYHSTTRYHRQQYFRLIKRYLPVATLENFREPKN